ncbi:anti-sigma factor family protein [Nakamurella sp. GG22]
MECREFVELVTAFVEGDLDDAGKGQVQHHLALCEGCRRYLDQYGDTVRGLQEMTPQPVDAALRAELLQKFRETRR